MGWSAGRSVVQLHQPGVGVTTLRRRRQTTDSTSAFHSAQSTGVPSSHCRFYIENPNGRRLISRVLTGSVSQEAAIGILRQQYGTSVSGLDCCGRGRVFNHRFNKKNAFSCWEAAGRQPAVISCRLKGVGKLREKKKEKGKSAGELEKDNML